MKRKLPSLCLAGSVLVLATSAAAASLTGAQAAKLRTTNFQAMGASFKRLNDELKKSDPDIRIVREMADKVDLQTKALSTWFPAGSGPSGRIETRALPAIWTNGTQFTVKANAAIAESAKLKAAAAAGNWATIRPQAKRLGAECGSCHKQFRAEEE